MLVPQCSRHRHTMIVGLLLSFLSKMVHGSCKPSSKRSTVAIRVCGVRGHQTAVSGVASAQGGDKLCVPESSLTQSCKNTES